MVAELELAAARSAVGATLARLDIALEASQVGIWERDLRTGRMFWDERNAAIFGLEGPQEFTGDTDQLMAQIHPDDHPAVREAMRSALEGSGEFLAEMRVLRADGEVRWAVSRGRVVRDPRGEPVRFLGTTVDVTDAREAAQRRLASLQRTTAIAEVAAELARATRIDELAQITLRGAEVLGAHTGAVAVFAPGKGVLRLHMGRRLMDIVEVAASEAGVEMPPHGVEIPLDDLLPTQWVARHGERVLLADPVEAVARFPGMEGLTEVLNARALAALPLRVEDRVLGTFVALWEHQHPFADDDIEVLEALTAQIALSVSRLQADAQRDAAVAEMAAANARLELLAETGRVLSGTLDITEQLGELGQLVVPALGDWCWIVVTDDHGRMRQLASAHRDPARTGELDDYVRRDGRRDDRARRRPGGQPHRPAAGGHLPGRRVPRPGAARPRGPGRAGPARAGVGDRRPAGRPGADAGRAGPVQRRGPRPAHRRRAGDRAGAGPAGRGGAAAGPAVRAAAPAGRDAAAQHAHRPAGARPLRDRRPVRPGGRRRRDRRRLVRRVRAARRRDDAGDRRRRRPRQRRGGGDGPAARAAARHRPPQRRDARRGAHGAGPRPPPGWTWTRSPPR